MRAYAAVLLPLLFAADAYPPPFPRPGVTKLLENDRVVVWDVVWPKGQPTPLHRHVYDLAGTYYASGDRVVTTLDGTKRAVKTEAGGIAWQLRGVTHIEEGTSDVPLRAVMIELKEDGPSGIADAASDLPPAFPRPGAQQLLDNERVTVWQYAWTLGKPVPMHRHVRDAVVVWLAEGKLRSTPQGGTPSIVEAATAHAVFSRRGTVHTEEVIEGSVRAKIFELK